MNKFILALVIVGLILIGAAAFVLLGGVPDGTSDHQQQAAPVVEQEQEVAPQEAPAPEAEAPAFYEQNVIGTSAGGHDIVMHHFGTGATELLFVGGIHGGYSWNTVLVAYELIDYLEAHPEVVPETVRVNVLPVLNPDGLEAVVGTTGRFSRADVPASRTATVPGRFNARGVDLNRNFDCRWQETGRWQQREVSGGTAPLSEPESRALSKWVAAHTPDAVVVWYSAAGGVFASSCGEGILPQTRTLMERYADASGYPSFDQYDFYEITGDMVNALAREGIAGISVLLSTHEDVEWERNRKGIEALLSSFAP